MCLSVHMDMCAYMYIVNFFLPASCDAGGTFTPPQWFKDFLPCILAQGNQRLPEGDRRAPITGRVNARAATEKIQKHFWFQRGPCLPQPLAFPGNVGQVRNISLLLCITLSCLHSPCFTGKLFSAATFLCFRECYSSRWFFFFYFRLKPGPS